MTLSWQDALLKLHVRGWDTDDIDLAAEALLEACTEGDFEGTEISALGDGDVVQILEQRVPEDECRALRVIGQVRAQQGPESDALQRAIYDLDAFAYAYAGVD